MSKYKKGDKFIIEIEEKCAPDMYKIKGFNTLVFDSNGLHRLQKYEDKVQQPTTDVFDIGDCVNCWMEDETFHEGVVLAQYSDDAVVVSLDFIAEPLIIQKSNCYKTGIISTFVETAFG